MRLTTKGRFAVTAMIDLGLYVQDRPVKLADISERQNISLSYLEQLFRKLRHAELVDSVRGPGGGYVLGRCPAEMTIADIIFAVDEPIDATVCGNSSCTTGKNGHGGNCMTHELWTNLNNKILDYLNSVSLQDLCDKQKSRTVEQKNEQTLTVMSGPYAEGVATR